jgi:hypothetical protein
MTFNLKVHHYQKQRDGGTKLVKVTPYCRLTNPNTNAKVFLQNGKAWDAQGNEITPTPDWCLDRLKTMNPTVVRECGFGFLVDKDANMDLSLAERLQLSVQKGILTQAECDRMIAEANVTTEVTGAEIPEENDAPRETLLDLNKLPDDMTFFELRSYCKTLDIDVDKKDKRQDLLDKVQQHEALTVPAA